MLGIEFVERGELNPDLSNLRTVINATHHLLSQHVWNVNRLQHVLGPWNWLLVPRLPAMAALQRCYVLSSCGDKWVRDKLDTKHELRMLLGLMSLLYSKMDSQLSDVML